MRLKIKGFKSNPTFKKNMEVHSQRLKESFFDKLCVISGTTDLSVPNFQCENGCTALIWAAQKGRTKVVQVLLANRASSHLRDTHGWTALSWAVRSGHDAVANMLLHAHAEHFSHYSDLPLAVVGDKAMKKVLQDMTTGSSKRKVRT